MTLQEYIEKRSFPRLQVQTVVKYSIAGQNEQTYKGISLNLSANGLLMSSEYAPQMGDKVHLIMNTSHQKFEPFETQGEVIRVQEDPNHSKGHYLISIALKTE